MSDEYRALGETEETEKKKNTTFIAGVIGVVLIVGLSIAVIVLAVQLNSVDNDPADTPSPNALDEDTIKRINSFMGNANPCDGKFIQLINPIMT